jgi:hypothetical protein
MALLRRFFVVGDRGGFWIAVVEREWVFYREGFFGKTNRGG